MDIFNSYVSLPEGNDGLMIINMKMGDILYSSMMMVDESLL